MMMELRLDQRKSIPCQPPSRTLRSRYTLYILEDGRCTLGRRHHIGAATLIDGFDFVCPAAA